MAVLRDLASVAICAMNEYSRCNDDAWRQFQSIQADAIEVIAKPIQPSVMLEVKLQHGSMSCCHDARFDCCCFGLQQELL